MAAKSDQSHESPGFEGLLAQRLYDARRKAGWTQAELGDRAGMERRQIQRYEAGTGAPTVLNLRRLCDALRLSPNALIYGAETPFDAPSTYDRIAKGGSDTEVIPKLAMILMLVDMNDRRTLTDLMVRLAESKHGSDVNDLLEQFGVIFDQVASHPGIRNAVDDTVDMFGPDDGER